MYIIDPAVVQYPEVQSVEIHEPIINNETKPVLQNQYNVYRERAEIINNSYIILDSTGLIVINITKILCA